jgi:curved DNA-binding protein CbpA
MKKIIFLLTLFVCVVVAAGSSTTWSALDREIFRLNDQVSQDLGEKTSFYDWLEVSPKASPEEIHSAYKRLSRKIHPDKVRRKLGTKRIKEATDRFTRLGLINKILRDTDSKERYDFFLEHGFPKLRGSDYFYSRYRPGVGFVTIFLFLLVGFGHYVALKITASQHRKHMSLIIKDAKAAAWPAGFPESGKKKVSLPNGKIFMVYPDGGVNLIENNVEYPLLLQDIHDPELKDTLLYSLPLKLFHQFFPAKPPGRVLGTKDKSDSSTSAAAEAESKSSEEKSKPKAKPAVKAGGRRRK